MSIKSKFNIFIILSLFLSVLMLTGCSKDTLEKYAEEGYTIKVSYDMNGGSCLYKEGATLIDLFNPDDYEADASGVKHIKVLDPSDTSRSSGQGDGQSITKVGYSLLGWYQTKNDDGTYSDKWDFNTDTIDYTSDMSSYDLTLYAVWGEYFTFNYYWLHDGKAELIETDSFDCTSGVSDTVYLPSYKDGAMNYTTKLEGTSYKFPKEDGYTFEAAYLDESMTVKIDAESYKHPGVIDYETGTTKNGVANIYITYTEGEQYKITEASQIMANPNLNGIYEIENDLDFTGVTWPAMFDSGEFTGKFYAKDESGVKISNITVKHNSSSEYGGIFGKLGAGSELKNITFENVTVDYQSIGSRNLYASFGLLCGEIYENADDTSKNAVITNIALTGTLVMRIGAIAYDSSQLFNLVANGDTANISVSLSDIKLYIYGTSSAGQYKFSVDPDSGKTTVDTESGNITFTLTGSLKESKRDQEEYLVYPIQ